MYRVVFAGWSNPRRADLSGYNAWDYLSGNVPSAFATRAEAASWLRSHRLGKDRYGVSAKFKIAKGASNSARKNPTKAQKREKTRKVSARRRIAVALQNFVRKANPAAKGVVKATKVKGGWNVRVVDVRRSK